MSQGRSDTLTESSVRAEHAALVAWRGPILAGVLLTTLLGFLFWDFFSRQVKFAVKQQADWGHTLLIPVIAGYFIYLNREKLLSRPFRTTWIGLVPVLAGVGWYMVCIFGPQQLWHHNLRSVGVITTLAGLALTFCGWRAMAWLWFPLAYLFVFGQTISERFMLRLTEQLQDYTAFGAFHVLKAMTIDVDLAGNTITLFDDGVEKPLNIAEACSGMRMLMAFMALGVAMAYTGLRTYWQRALLVIAGVPTAIFVNILRVVTLSLLTMIDSDFAAGDFHSFVGLVWLLPAFLIFLGAMWVIRNLVTEGEAA